LFGCEVDGERSVVEGEVGAVAGPGNPRGDRHEAGDRGQCADRRIGGRSVLRYRFRTRNVARTAAWSEPGLAALLDVDEYLHPPSAPKVLEDACDFVETDVLHPGFCGVGTGIDEFDDALEDLGGVPT
jgi:hypothetical protein